MLPRGNIFAKSAMRQPARSLLLAVLIGASLFAAVSRFVEYMVVSEQIRTIAGFFQSTGALVSLDGNPAADAREAADLIESNPLVVFGDRRRGFEGLLRDIQNPSHPGESHWLAPAYFPRPVGPWLSEDPTMFSRDRARFDLIAWGHFRYRDYPGFARYESSDAFFSGTLVDMYYTTALDPDYHDTGLIWLGDSWFAPNVNLVVRADNVLAGYYDHVSSGAYVILRYHLIDGGHPFDGLEIGGRYFFKGTRYFLLGDGGHSPFSREAGIDNPRRRNVLFSQPLNDEGLFYVPLADGMPDFDALGLPHIHNEIVFTNHVQRNVFIRTTRDMAAIDADAISVLSGRLPNLEDYAEARHVVAIHQVFANQRGLGVGDTIRVEVKREQHIVEADFYFERWTASYLGTFRDLLALSNPLADSVHELELEIIGIYDMYRMEWPEVHVSSIPRTVFIPDSLLPGLHVLTAPWGELPQDYIPAVWYSFVLRDSRYVDGFIESYGGILEEMGFHLSFRGASSANFWISANITLQSMAINAALFAILLMLALMLSGYFAISQRRRDFAVLQALGLPTKSIKAQFVAANMALWVPAIIAGSWLGWNYSMEMAMGTLRPFAEMLVDSIGEWRPWVIEEMTANFLSAALPSASLLVLMCAAAIAAVFALLLGGLRVLLRYPVLEQLQGRQAAKIVRTKTRKDNVALDNFVHAASGDSPELSFVMFHILRSPLRTALSLLVALVFALSLGLLSETIHRAAGEIDRLYDTTTVYAEVIWDPEDSNRDNPRAMRDMIPRHNFLSVFSHGFINEYFVEANNGGISVLLPRNRAGDFPHDLLQGARLDENSELHVGGGLSRQVVDSFDGLFATNELRFFTENPTGFAGRFANTPQTMQNMEIVWADGFDESRFEYRESGPVPVIISQRIAGDRMLGLGDEIFIAYTNSFEHMQYLDEAAQVQRGLRDLLTLEMPEWRYAEGIVAGIHNGRALMDLRMQAAIVPLAALESLYGNELGYETLRFGIDASFNRDLQSVSEALAQAVRFLPGGWWNSITAVIHDRELMFVIVPMEENLALLQLLFPIAVVLSALMGAGIHILLMLQNAKNAAIMAVLGTSRRKTKLMLGFQLILVSICGIAAAMLILVAAVGIRFDLAISALPFLIGSIAGAIAGAELTTNKAPLELLQVKE